MIFIVRKPESKIAAVQEKSLAKEKNIPPELEFDESRRSKLQILIDILRLIQRKGGLAKSTHILYGANLSHVRLMKYLNWLLVQGMIETSDYAGHTVYRITPKGYEFMREFRKIQSFSEAFGIPI